MSRIAVFPGSFDPFTKGHESVVHRFLPLFDKVFIGMGVNSNKKYFYSTESRLNHIKSLFAGNEKVHVETFEGLTVEYCKQKKARFLIRGIRNTTDFEFEKAIAHMNQSLSGIETIFVMTDPALSGIHSTIVREIVRNGGDISKFVTNQEHLVIL